MNFHKRIVLLLLSVIILQFILSPSSLAAARIDVRATERVNVRKGPGSTYAILGELEAGEALQKLGNSEGWSKVSYKGITGYVFSKYLEIVYAYNDGEVIDLVVATSISDEPIHGKSEIGAIYNRIEVKDGWSYIRGTKELSEFDHVAGWIRSSKVILLTIIDSDSFPDAYLNKKLKLSQLPKGKSKGSAFSKGTKVREWGRYSDWSYVTVWTEDGKSHSGFVKTKYVSLT